MEAATAADLTQASEIAGRYITLGSTAKGYGPGQGLPASPWPGPGGSSAAQNVSSGPNHQKWPESGPESTVWLETWSRSMSGPFRSLWDGSNPLQGAVPGEKSKKVCPSRPRLMTVWIYVGLFDPEGSPPKPQHRPAAGRLM